MGSLMCIGLTSANSILVVTFANQRMGEGDDKATAAIVAGYTRLRPVIDDRRRDDRRHDPDGAWASAKAASSETEAPLARAVIGGLLFATFATLIFVPAMYGLLRKAGRTPRSSVRLLPHLPNRRRSFAGMSGNQFRAGYDRDDAHPARKTSIPAKAPETRETTRQGKFPPSRRYSRGTGGRGLRFIVTVPPSRWRSGLGFFFVHAPEKIGGGSVDLADATRRGRDGKRCRASMWSRSNRRRPRSLSRCRARPPHGTKP